MPLKTDTHLTNHYFWKQTALQIHELEKSIVDQTGQTPLIVGLSKWSVASALRFYDTDKQVDNIVSRNAIGKTASMYEQWTDPAKWDGHPVIFVSLDINDLDSTEVKRHTNNIGPIINDDIYSNNNKLRTLSYRTAEQYKH